MNTATISVSVTFDATNREDAYKKMADHFAMLARLEANGMDHGTGAKWFEGSITVDLAEKPKTPAGG